ncbi:Protein-S-isoprenylcysteine O-methyltransferase Ste14 [Pseudorhodobacter antarcticus]|jgi:protein-S-isoprenylcysteine O-methyltransferase Ste14|uniref:Protein-S-isoprenylcysteine O-methyltransferase Ste14 n=1 Tax=Pseudorhodobacter antarcticus TaxID=1077947 RepID=A0A1H8GC67_9RHOB|nr:isoprenylcysteine carboxylmethyltransferase family protein [Pseudorhodobacter antarcticus]SEN41360.1 Protein-S-isoprenylcysteine O-methyltransferase Ste14 [Pseudorhodobacter antarcticus]
MQRFEWPPVWLAVGLAAIWGLGRVVSFGSPALVTLGWAIIATGLIFMGLAVFEMTRARTTVIPRRRASHLVTTGVFRYSRNPIYLGDSLILLGACLIWSSPLGLAVVPAFVFVITQRFIKAEEAALAQYFGPDYAAWSTNTRRWV